MSKFNNMIEKSLKSLDFGSPFVAQPEPIETADALWEDPIVQVGIMVAVFATLFSAYVVSVVNRIVWSRGEGSLPMYYKQ